VVRIPDGIVRRATALTAAALVGATLACAPVDEVPPPDAEKQARITQLGDVLKAAADGRPPNMDPFVERLENLSRFPPAESASRALAQTLIDGLPGTPVTRDASERVAVHLYRLMNGGYLKRPELERVTRELERELVTAGMDAQTAAAVRRAGIRAARDPRDPRTDWW
jgi:hypothetical protein